MCFFSGSVNTSAAHTFSRKLVPKAEKTIMGKRARGVRERVGGEGRGGEGIEVAVKVQKGSFASKSDVQGQDQTGNFAKIGLKKSRKQLLLPPPRTAEMIYCHGLNGNLELYNVRY